VSQIDDALEQGVKKRYWQVLVAVPLFALLAVYLSWLFLTKGFTVKVYPAEAEQTQQFSVDSGVGFFIDNTFYLVGSQARIKVSAIKFEAKDVLVLASQDSNLSVTLDPLPAIVNVTTTPNVTDINWSINDQIVSQGGTLNHKLKPGNYQIKANHPAYQPASMFVEVAAGDEISEALTLTPVEGDLVLTSRPAGAAILIDGKQVGQTPLSLSKPGGIYAVEINLLGYEPINDSIALTYQQPVQERNYFLQPVQAKLLVNASPADGVLMLNNKPAQSPVSLDAGKAYIVRYEKAGYLPRTERLTLQAGEQRSLDWQLKPEMGLVALTASETAEVLINGVQQGKTPLKLSLQTVSQQIEFRKPGYRSVSRTVTPSAKGLQTVKAEMLTEFAARRLEGKPLFAETLGFSFIGIQPRSFTMGSPPNEQGRMRNEHQIKVDFTRSILVSKHEVTEAQFAAFTGTTAGSNLPVTQISWLEAVKFTNWLSEKEGLSPFYIVQGNLVSGIHADSQGYRLLTEAEWEFIAKHNGRSARTSYVWGNEDRLRTKQGNFADKSLQGQQTFIFRDYEDVFAGKAPVGSFKADRAGFFDLDGNVREWVHDVYALNVPDTEKVHIDYMGVSRGQGRVVKGASFKTGRLKELRASMRSEGSGPEDDIGFRIARFN
jgi:formylglycine-generating enzyme required for sulfatase activity